jgi:outer membrane protein assembly factor BamB
VTRRRIEPPPAAVALAALAALATLMAAAPPCPAADQPRWGRAWSRNMTSDETGLPEAVDPATGAGIRWTVPLGTETYGTPIVAGGRVYIGTNNHRPRDPRHDGDRGVLLALDEKDGRLLWQLVTPKIPGDPYRDWPGAGACSPATVEGDRVYVVSSRYEVLCLDARGLADGNGGPFTDEGAYMTPPEAAPMTPGPLDADILWAFDLREGAGIYPHDAAHVSIVIDGPLLYLNTSNGVDNTHKVIRKPDAPSLIALEKATGRLVARDAERIGPNIFHSTWSAPSMGEVGGKKLVVFAGGDGVVYAFKPLDAVPPAGEVRTFERIWRFDCDPAAPKENVHEYLRNRKESPSNIKGMPVFVDGRVYVAAGGDIWWGKNEANLKCIDAAGAGDVTASAGLWSYPLNRHCCTTPAVIDGLVYIGDCAGTVHCVDSKTGQAVWTHEAGGDIWASPLVADGKVYVATRRGRLIIFAAGREKRILSEAQLDGPVSGTPTAANGTLYIATMKTLYAFAKTAK